MPKPKIAILDGGLGTHLENIIGDEVSKGPLWSTQAVISHPLSVLKTHRNFINAGATIIETATYQASLPGLIKSGLQEYEARELMWKAVSLAKEAAADSDASIALSLGPFGATLRPTQEFEGFYPPPYGPKAYHPEGPNTQAFDSNEAEARAIGALAQFHLDRLLVFSQNSAVWDSIQYLAFETLLLPREVIAIRKAVGLLRTHLFKEHRSFDKSWWISFVVPSDATNPSVLPLVSSALCEGHDLPSAIGINCTSFGTLLPRTLELCRLVPRFRPLSQLGLVLYPNGGTYDTTNQRWLPDPVDADRQWGLALRDVLTGVLSETGAEGWRELIAGGCCRTGPSHISQFAELLREFQE
ncbi:homocysteine S-methyltransferase [Coprinopsis cinerea okayama7|uniref:Homocysteine S-methyltransferase n=1 Tax=Coprinopsis cinerea (strain Okayama-7 / 130 / ATCC MYA-4618 / FGSC 9003) TaxID=240176 RepID=A8N5L5_COPC7|nr:homocysteine S-methyltransferase [Coprinopsis cinerea okayama7\|eukprot:XP_001830160.1 homocysteine S-methyltransferase [Coprinopsis cinerea okayama7\